jgi:alkanesulfonate monooxygenase SsuD/methylene tetrahydromethanopterin reductase-like flavin-dependent oxidoreductase (luciferase family)
MKFGLSVPVQHPRGEPSVERIRELLEQVKLARDLGFDSISASQHYLAAPFQYFQPIPLLARIAAESGAMTLITNILLLPLYNPVDLAEQLATLDIICDGRLVCGVGLGYRDVEYTVFGVEWAMRVGRFGGRGLTPMCFALSSARPQQKPRQHHFMDFICAAADAGMSGDMIKARQR